MLHPFAGEQGRHMRQQRSWQLQMRSHQHPRQLQQAMLLVRGLSRKRLSLQLRGNQTREQTQQPHLKPQLSLLGLLQRQRAMLRRRLKCQQISRSQC